MDKTLLIHSNFHGNILHTSQILLQIRHQKITTQLTLILLQIKTRESQRKRERKSFLSNVVSSYLPGSLSQTEPVLFSVLQVAYLAESRRLIFFEIPRPEFFFSSSFFIAFLMEYFLREIEGKQAHDPLFMNNNKSSLSSSSSSSFSTVWVHGPVIVGAGPSGLAAAACLREKSVPSVILERSNCIASLWQLKTYDRLRLHLPKQFCELPFMGFPSHFPTYPSKQQFVQYLENYAERFGIRPRFNETVQHAEFDAKLGLWRVKSVDKAEKTTEYVCRWLIVATGENAEAVVPDIEGVEEFGAPIKHTSLYKSGEEFRGKRVLVVGCGNSGMEVCLDLCNHNATPSLVVRDTVRTLTLTHLFAFELWL